MQKFKKKFFIKNKNLKPKQFSYIYISFSLKHSFFLTLSIFYIFQEQSQDVFHIWHKSSFASNKMKMSRGPKKAPLS